MDTKAILLFPLVAFLMSACTGQQLQHSPSTIDDLTAKSIIEQVFMEQPVQYRPEFVAFDERFIGLSEGTSAKTKSGGIGVPLNSGIVLTTADGRATTKEVNSRFYYTSIGEVRLYKKRDWFILQIRSTEGRIMKNIYTTNERNANQFIDAVQTLKANGK